MSASFTAKPSLAADLRARAASASALPDSVPNRIVSGTRALGDAAGTADAGALAACTPARNPDNHARCSAVAVEKDAVQRGDLLNAERSARR